MKQQILVPKCKVAVVSSVFLINAVDGFSWTPVPSTTSIHARSKIIRLSAQRSSFNAERSSLPSNQFVRIQSRTCLGSRQCFELQTAVTSFTKVNEEGKRQSIDLHAQLHFGEKDYFDYFNTEEFSSSYDSIHYELLIDDGFMESTQSCQRKLKASPDGSPILMASPSDQRTAQQFGLNCQVDCIDYGNPIWIHADMTRQELLAAAGTTDTLQPLWSLTSTASTWPGAEAVSALFRPLTPSAPMNTPVDRRLFSNLFLPGNALTAFFRSLFWLAIPAPELFVMVLDWSSMLPRPSGGISQVALPVLESFLTGNFHEARKLVFAQMIVSGQQSSTDEKLLIIRRNEKAIESIKKSLETGSNHRLAVLYGSMHCSHLRDKLIDLGFIPAKTSWRTVWSVQTPSFGPSKSIGGALENPFISIVSPNAIIIGLVVLPLYFLIGGIDWIAVLQDVTQEVETGDYIDASIETLLYLTRHVLLYLSLAKFVVEWDGGRSLKR